jgi:hypothetical protein
VDLASLDKSKLIGESNKFNQNFDIRGRSSKETYGKNIGNRINPSTYVVSLSTPIVALEKFSNTYTLINTYQPLSVVNATHYPLSSYSDDWGWPLVLPSDFSFDHIEKYYLFFEYNGQYDDTTIGSIVNYDDSRTTIESSYTNGELFDVNGVFDNMFLDTLYQSLSLV